MTFDENSPVRYLMKEMDPSEELLFEKKMMEDENLLIEVESLRKANHRLADLPLLDPPQRLRRNVLLEASERSRRENVSSRRYYLSAAAALLLTFTAGAYLLVGESEPAASADAGSADVPAPASAPAITPPTLALPSIQTPETPASASGAADNPAPWVDNNQELHFLDRFSSEHAERFDSLFHNSMQRLRPLRDDGGDGRDPARGLHLTGSQN